MQNKIWRYKNSGLTTEKISAFAQQNHVPHVIAAILLNRGIQTEAQVKAYLQKSLECVHNPNLLNDMEQAAARILTAINNHEKIVIYGDYDVDGITSTALLYKFLKKEGADVEYYIPDRLSEGYGINIMAINKISRSGAKLLITVDCGITAVGEIELAKAQKMDVIVTDHHTCKEKLPDATAVINPKRPDSTYPFDALAGVGVAFKLALAVTMALGKSTKACFDEYVELAAIGTIADVVTLLDENRVIVDRGLKQLQHTGNVGIKALIDVAGIKNIDASAVAFFLSPRLNAAGRLGAAQSAVQLLLCEDAREAYLAAQNLNEENRQRQMTEQKILEEAQAMIAGDPNFELKKVIVLAKEGWHHGVIGIVASRLCEKFTKPCILLACENGVAKGSGRSVGSFNLFEALSACEDLLTNFGGHAMAAGVGLNTTELDAFAAKINKYADAHMAPEDLVKQIDIDCSISPSSITLENARLLLHLEPFGMGNEKPVFASRGLRIHAINTMGIDNKHLRVRLSHKNKNIQAVGFHMGAYSAGFKEGDLVDIVYTMDINSYQGNEQVQLLLKDIKHSGRG